jgi:UDP-N-acetylmuramoyl-tripeptide--D-alanyl-D-alanine ligase
MKKFSIASLVKIIKAKSTKNISGFIIGVSTDSRTIQAGDCFFAIAGGNFNGHDYIPEAFAKGAVCAVVKNTEGKKFTGDCILKVKDTIKALGDFAGEYRRLRNFKVIAITGSVGKTTTRQIAYHILSQHYCVFQAPKNFNNNIGLPLTLLGANLEHEIIIAELGSNHPGEIAYLTQIAQPDIAVITNVHPAHLAGFGDLQTTIQEKLAISQGLRDNGVLIINADCDWLVDACRTKSTRFTTFGKSDRCDIQAHNITYNSLGSRFTIDSTQISLPLPGAGNVENAIAAWSICSRFGINIDDFAKSVKTLPAVPMRAELLQVGTLTVLNDCYNANPASMRNALDILIKLGSVKKRRLVFICGDMAELGQQSERLHAEMGASITQAKVQLLLAIGKFAKITAEAAKESAEYDLQTKFFEDTLSACNNLGKFIKDYDIVLVKGSRVAKLEMSIEKLKELFS